MDRAIVKAALDLIFPENCLVCGLEGSWLCSRCEQEIEFKPIELCPICKQVNCDCPQGKLKSLTALFDYRTNFAEAAIRRLKYDLIIGVSTQAMAPFFKRFVESDAWSFSNKAVFIPIPLHRRRYLERGFNQSELIARGLSSCSGNPVVTDLLIRTVYNKPQVGLSGAARRQNIRGIMKANYRRLSDVWGRELVLIDDVYTTGSTMMEAAAVLDSAGLGPVRVIAFASD